MRTLELLEHNCANLLETLETLVQKATRVIAAACQPPCKSHPGSMATAAGRIRE